MTALDRQHWYEQRAVRGVNPGTGAIVNADGECESGTLKVEQAYTHVSEEEPPRAN
jgi:hypothetical protein